MREGRAEKNSTEWQEMFSTSPTTKRQYTAGYNEKQS